MSDPELRDPRLDQAYRELPSEEPPSELDERIRAAARRAVGARPQSLEARDPARDMLTPGAAVIRRVRVETTG